MSNNLKPIPCQRLTMRNELGLAYFPDCFIAPCDGDGCERGDCDLIAEACQRLAWYEDEEERRDMLAWRDARAEIPIDQEEVLVCTRSKNGVRNIDKGYYAIDRWNHRGCAEVTHWMPLPAFPGEEG